MRQSARASPGDGTAACRSWTLRSVFVNVPSFSAKLAAGSTTSASAAVSVRKMSWTTRKSRPRSASSTCVRSGSESIGFSPMT